MSLLLSDKKGHLTVEPLEDERRRQKEYTDAAVKSAVDALNRRDDTLARDARSTKSHLSGRINNLTGRVESDVKSLRRAVNDTEERVDHLRRCQDSNFRENQNMRTRSWTPYYTGDLKRCARTCPTPAYTYRHDGWCWCRHGKAEQKQFYYQSGHWSGATCDF